MKRKAPIVSALAANLGVVGSPAFPAAAKTLDRNSVALSKSIAAVCGNAAGLPPKAAQADLLQHVLELKGQLERVSIRTPTRTCS